ncbi:MAG: threonine synthase [Nitrososphaerota archaeon]|nr:threonine synthase [Nitrososphaerota archaeon]MDG6941516.1 threonine synthase [Nitrososphaerota archaeon]MDG6951057.1 threonine synthase [Nitrososphaerota archaeon]
MEREAEGAAVAGVRCVSCGNRFSSAKVLGTCPYCGSILSCEYDYERAKETLTRESLRGRRKTLWRYREVRRDVAPQNIVTLGEGMTPVVRLESGPLKDDGIIPTGTFKARGMAVAVSKAEDLGLAKLAVQSAGNAGAALACYAALGGLAARVFMPTETPQSILECAWYGAEVILVDGNIGDAGARMRTKMDGYFDMSTLKEPYRLEGKKTMGYEIAEQTGFELPEAIVYPTGGGTGLLGMWKAFDELENLGLIGSERPTMFSVQSEACAPIVDAFSPGKETPDADFPDGVTAAVGLRVPRPFAGRQMLSVLRESKGGAVSVSDPEILAGMRALAGEGVLACPEGAASLAAHRKLLREGNIAKDEKVLLYNTGTGQVPRPRPASP